MAEIKIADIPVHKPIRVRVMWEENWVDLELDDPEDVKNIIRIIESKSGFPREIDAKAQIFEGLENYGSYRSLAEEINHIMMGDVVEIKETIDQLWGICNPDPVIINPKGNPNNATGK